VVTAVGASAAVGLGAAVDRDAVSGALAGSSGAWLGVALALHGGAILLRSTRLAALLPAPPPAGTMAAVTGVGALAIALLPLRLGEGVRPVLLARRGVALADAVAAVVVERALDLAGLLGLLLVVGALAPLGPVVVAGLDVLPAARATVLAAGAAGLAGLVAVAVVGPRVASALARTPLAFVARPVAALAEAVRGVTAARIGSAAGQTVVLWAVTVAEVLAALAAVPGAPVSVPAAAATWAACSAATTLVPSPGFVGPFEAGVAGAVVALGGAPEVGAAVGLSLHVVQALGFAVAGLLGGLALTSR
jgi:hypothetical protein